MATPNYVLALLRKTQVPEKEIQACIHSLKSELGVVFAAIGLSGYKIIPYGSAVTGLFTNGEYTEDYSTGGGIQAINLSF